MYKEKYLADIDKTLQNFIKKQASDGFSNKILYSEELEENNSIKKIAFDVYKVENDPYNGLWTLEDVDGQPYLIRASNPQYDSSDNGEWSVASNYDKNNITLSYKNVPIARFSSDKYGFTSNDIISFKSALIDNLKDQEFIKDILLEQPESKRSALANTFPEFQKIIKG